MVSLTVYSTGGDIHDFIDFLVVNAPILKLLHSWLFMDPSEHHYTTQTSKFNNFLNRSSTKLNNVFKTVFPVSIVSARKPVIRWENMEMPDLFTEMIYGRLS